jgi:hypothetical protein
MRLGFLAVGGLAASLGTVTGCGAVDSNEFAGATPTQDTVALTVPGGGASASTTTTASGVVQSALLGQQADSYTLTRTVTAAVNGGTAAVLILIDTIVQFPPTTVSGDTAVWGPHSEPLDKNAWRLTVTRVAPEVFNWVFDGKPKTADDTAFVTIASGAHTRALDGAGHPMHGFGSGTFTLDWDAAQTLPDHDNNVGVATFTYSRLDPTATVTIDVAFNGVQDQTTKEIFNAVYQFSATPGAGGELRYGSLQDLYPDPHPSGTADEHLSVHSRWLESGAGRTDYQMWGGDLPASVSPVTVSECWDTTFASVYKNVSVDPTQDWGAESSCAIAPADFITLSP